MPFARQIQPNFPAGGGDMGTRIRAYDWSQTSLGPIRKWPQSLITAIQIMLDSRYPMFVWWGPELVNLYNDYHVAVHGKRHPQALGMPAHDVWTEVWAILGPQTESVLREGRSTWNEEILLPLERNGYPEETYFTFSYSPVRDVDGSVLGLFGVCTEDTARVVSQRRLKTLRELGERTLRQNKTAEKAVIAATETLGDNPLDVPVALVYLLDKDGKAARLAASTPLDPDTRAPSEMILGSDDDILGFNLVLEKGVTQIIENLDVRLGRLSGEARPEMIGRAAVVPLAKPGVQDVPAGFLVAGVSARLKFDDDYRAFLELAGGQTAAAIANARAYEEERQRAEALAEIDRAKTLFFSNVSHEFRTPLTLMLGPLEALLAKREGMPAEDHAQIEIAHRNSLRLLKLVNSLLDFSRIEAERVRAAFEAVDLARFTTDIASHFRSAMEAGGLQFVVNCQPLSQPIYVDREMWEKIVLNLLSNAFKFTLFGTVTVRLEQDDDKAILTISDTGVGIPESDLPHIFENFYRVESAKGRTYEGSGIGLALIQQLVRLHGGTVEAKSSAGKGSIFTVKLPLGKAHLPEERISPSATDQSSTTLRSRAFTSEATMWLGGNRPANPSNDIPPSSTHVSSKPHVLIADDNADMREHLAHILEPSYRVTAVPDGHAALMAAREMMPDLIVTDVMMPSLDGFGVLRELRADTRLRQIPIILLSARAGEESRVEGLEADADDYLVKPFSARELVARVNTNYKMSRMRQEIKQAALQATEQRRVLQLVFEGQEEERRRIARELHDEAGQLLTALLVSLRRLKCSRTLVAAKTIAREASGTGRRILDELSALAHGLHPSVLTDHGLEGAVTSYAAEYEKRYGIRVSLTIKALPEKLPEAVQIAAYRIIQEALTNVARHAGVKTVAVKLSKLSNMLEVAVIDRGCGFDIHTSVDSSSNHLGLRSMRERSASLGGEIVATSGKTGTEVRARLPVPEC